jgi:uncharacterized protein
MRARAFVVGAVLALDPVSAVNAASFDCKPYVRSRACPEVVICQTPGLSAKDADLANTYTGIKSGIVDGMAARRLVLEQREWLAHRDACRCNAECISDEYDIRSIELFRIMNIGQ